MAEEVVVWTFGYREHTHDELKRHAEKGLVVDVRRDATSGTPHWSAGELVGLLGPDHYLHLPALGNSKGAGKGEWQPANAREAAEALEQLQRLYLEGKGPVVLLCAEFRNRDCHRRQVAEQLRRRLTAALPGVTVAVRHLL